MTKQLHRLLFWLIGILSAASPLGLTGCPGATEDMPEDGGGAGFGIDPLDAGAVLVDGGAIQHGIEDAGESVADGGDLAPVGMDAGESQVDGGDLDPGHMDAGGPAADGGGHGPVGMDAGGSHIDGGGNGPGHMDAGGPAADGGGHGPVGMDAGGSHVDGGDNGPGHIDAGESHVDGGNTGDGGVWSIDGGTQIGADGGFRTDAGVAVDAGAFMEDGGPVHDAGGAIDLCTGDDSTGDTDENGTCNDLDPDDDGDGCLDEVDDDPLVASVDTDSDGVAEDCDLCTGDDATGDTDTDGICDDLDPDTLPDDYADSLRVMAHNVYMLDEVLLDWAQTERAFMIAEAPYMQNWDVVLLQELFDNSAGDALLSALATAYPHQTTVMGRSVSGWDSTEGADLNTFFEDGGIAIVSKWPILEKVQYVQAPGCGADSFSAKGFVYVKIDKDGAPYHLISTHAQSQDSGCANGEPESVRATQFQVIRDWITAKNIPAEEMVIIGGDFNVIKGTTEYDSLWANLGATPPDTFVGVDYTWDPTSNSICQYNYPDLAGEYLDYVVVSANHAQPSHWHNLALDPVSPVWTAPVGGVPYRWYEYSDHYPVAGFAYADMNTPTKSYRSVSSPYNQVHFQNQENGSFVRADSSVADDWLRADASTTGTWTGHALTRWYDPVTSCLRSGDYVQVQPVARPTHYWNWWLGFSGNGGYYTAANDPVDRLRIEIQGDTGECLKDGDVIAFKDQWTPTGTDYFMRCRTDNRLFMEGTSVGDRERFMVNGIVAPVLKDWSDELVY